MGVELHLNLFFYRLALWLVSTCLLHYVGKLVGNKFLAAVGAWAVLTLTKEYIMPGGKGFSAELLVQDISFRISVHEDAAEISTKAVLHLIPDIIREGFPTSSGGVDLVFYSGVNFGDGIGCGTLNGIHRFCLEFFLLFLPLHRCGLSPAHSLHHLGGHVIRFLLVPIARRVDGQFGLYHHFGGCDSGFALRQEPSHGAVARRALERKNVGWAYGWRGSRCGALEGNRGINSGLECTFRLPQVLFLNLRLRPLCVLFVLIVRLAFCWHKTLLIRAYSSKNRASIAL